MKLYLYVLCQGGNKYVEIIILQGASGVFHCGRKPCCNTTFSVNLTKSHNFMTSPGGAYQIYRKNLQGEKNRQHKDFTLLYLEWMDKSNYL